MISVVIPTWNAERTLAHTLAALVPAVVDGLVQEAVVVDGGSSDDTRIIADAAGTQLIDAPRGRGRQLDAGAAASRGEWLLFLNSDTVLEPGWAEEARGFIERVGSGRRGPGAAYFRFALDDDGFVPRLVEWMVWLRCALFGLPSSDQGMLIPRALYVKLGGFGSLPFMEDVDLLRRLKRSQMAMLKSRAITSATRFQSEGYFARGLRNVGLVLLYYLRLPARALARLYS